MTGQNIVVFIHTKNKIFFRIGIVKEYFVQRNRNKTLKMFLYTQPYLCNHETDPIYTITREIVICRHTLKLVEIEFETKVFKEIAFSFLCLMPNIQHMPQLRSNAISKNKPKLISKFGTLLKQVILRRYKKLYGLNIPLLFK